jgi:hypothetical protein
LYCQCHFAASFHGQAYAFSEVFECLERVYEATVGLGSCAHDDAAVYEVVHPVSAPEHAAKAGPEGVEADVLELLALAAVGCVCRLVGCWHYDGHLQAVLLAEVAADAVFAWWKGSEDVFLCVAEVLVVDVECAALVAHGCVLAAGDAVDFDVHDFFFFRFTIYDLR